MNLNSFVLLLFVVLFSFNVSYACLSATQNRIFPLGLCAEGLIVVETHLRRTEIFDEAVNRDIIEPAWFGVSYLKIYDTESNLIRSELLDTLKLFKQDFYERTVGSTFNKGLLLAKRFPDFIKAKPKSIMFCDYQEICSKASIFCDTLNNQVSLILPNLGNYKLTQLFDTSSIASPLIHSLFEFDDGMLTVNTFKGNLYINSVRKFLVGEKELTIIHIGSGHVFELIGGGTYPPGNKYVADFAFNEIDKIVYFERVLHHGHGFDFFVFE